MTETIKKLLCLRCDHEWFPTSTKKPETCPRCKSKLWETKKIRAWERKSQKK